MATTETGLDKKAYGSEDENYTVQPSQHNSRMKCQMMNDGAQTVDSPDIVELLYGTNYASYITLNGSQNRLIYQGVAGDLYEAVYPRGPRWSSEKILPAGSAKLFTPLAITAARANESYIGLYYLSPTFTLSNLNFVNGKWVQGQLSKQGIKAAPYSQISVIAWNNGAQVRVYYQGNDTKIHEHVFGNKWLNGATLPATALPGTSLAFINRSTSGHPSIRGYYQTVTGELREVGWDNGWSSGALIHRGIPFRASIAATVSTVYNFPEMHIFWLSGYQIYEATNDNKGWSFQPTLIPHNSIAHISKLAASSFPRDRNNIDIRVYYTADLNAVMECIFRRAKWEEPGNPVPIGSTQAMAMLPEKEDAMSKEDEEACDAPRVWCPFFPIDYWWNLSHRHRGSSRVAKAAQ